MGLTCASRLLERGHRVEVVAREPGPATTSAVAAAMWYPYLAAPVDRVTAWGARTYDVLSSLADAEPASGVRVRPGRELFAVATPDPPWAATVGGVARLSGPALPPGYADGWTFATPLVDMARYLPWLGARVQAAGASVRTVHLASLREAAGGVDVVVDCAGLGARELVPDLSLVPVRGQVVVLGQVGLQEWTLDDSDPGRPTYVVPRVDTITCGGTADAGREDVEPDAEVAAAVLARCRALVPELGGAPVLAHRAGLRPARPSVRLERAGDVVHCYGHGGAGVTLSWGCAEEVAALVG